DSHSPLSSDAAPPYELSTLSLHDALPIYVCETKPLGPGKGPFLNAAVELRCVGVQPIELLASMLAIERSHGRERRERWGDRTLRSEEHTSELQSREKLVCRLLREKTKYTS